MTNIREPKTAGIPSNPREIEVGGQSIRLPCLQRFSRRCVWRKEKKRGNTKQVGGVNLLKKPNSLWKRSTDRLKDLVR